MTQSEMVLDYMERFGSISSWQAFMDLGITRLSGRIFDLRSQGHIIENKRIETTNRYGKRVHYDEYKLVKRVTA